MSTWTTYDHRTLSVSDLMVLIGKPGWDEATERTALALLVRAIRLAATYDELWDLARVLVWGAESAEAAAPAEAPTPMPEQDKMHPSIRAAYAWLDRRVAELSDEEAPVITEASSAAFERLTNAAVTDDAIAASPVLWKGRLWVCLKAHESVDYREARLAEVMTPGMYAFWREDPPIGCRNLSGTVLRDPSGSVWYLYGQECVLRGPVAPVATLKTLQSLWGDQEEQQTIPGLFDSLLMPPPRADQPQRLLSFA